MSRSLTDAMEFREPINPVEPDNLIDLIELINHDLADLNDLVEPVNAVEPINAVEPVNLLNTSSISASQHLGKNVFLSSAAFIIMICTNLATLFSRRISFFLPTLHNRQYRNTKSKFNIFKFSPSKVFSFYFEPYSPRLAKFLHSPPYILKSSIFAVIRNTRCSQLGTTAVLNGTRQSLVRTHAVIPDIRNSSPAVFAINRTWRTSNFPS